MKNLQELIEAKAAAECDKLYREKITAFYQDLQTTFGISDDEIKRVLPEIHNLRYAHSSTSIVNKLSPFYLTLYTRNFIKKVEETAELLEDSKHE